MVWVSHAGHHAAVIYGWEYHDWIAGVVCSDYTGGCIVMQRDAPPAPECRPPRGVPLSFPTLPAAALRPVGCPHGLAGSWDAARPCWVPGSPWIVVVPTRCHSSTSRPCVPVPCPSLVSQSCYGWLLRRVAVLCGVCPQCRAAVMRYGASWNMAKRGLPWGRDRCTGGTPPLAGGVGGRNGGGVDPGDACMSDAGVRQPSGPAAARGRGGRDGTARRAWRYVTGDMMRRADCVTTRDDGERAEGPRAS